MTKQQAVKKLAELVAQASELMEEATELSEKYGIPFEGEDGYPYYDEETEEDKLYETRRALMKWNSSTCY